jgi:hypothetical protein
VRQRPAHWIARLMLRHVFPYPWRFHLASRLLQIYQKTGLQSALRATGVLKLVAAKAETLIAWHTLCREGAHSQ